ncbi:MAG: alpha/beta hydrolase [Planctomycetaceae bacterium]|nr:alpha/beta hydrolase [Planctomycetaceae bacterium]
MLHGFGTSGTLWEPLVEASAADYRLTIPDLRGYGHDGPALRASLHTHGASYSVNQSSSSSSASTFVLYVASSNQRSFSLFHVL